MDELKLLDGDVKSGIFEMDEARGTERRSRPRGTIGAQAAQHWEEGLVGTTRDVPPRRHILGENVHKWWLAPGSTLNQVEKWMEVEAESKGTRFDPVRGW